MTSPVTIALDGVTLVTEIVLTWGRVFLRQRTEMPLLSLARFIMLEWWNRVSPHPVMEEDLQCPRLVKKLKLPRKYRRPPGKAVNPDEFVAPVFGGFQPLGVG